jgi:probable HAF family extracellular repeat protein
MSASFSIRTSQGARAALAWSLVAALAACSDQSTAPTVALPSAAKGGNAVPAIEIRDLGAPGAGLSVAASGLIVGVTTSTGVDHATVWSKGVMTDLGPVGQGRASRAYDVDARGQIVGSADTGGLPNTTVAVLWESGIPSILPSLGGTYSYARAINSSGDIVGNSGRSGDNLSQPVLWKDGLATVLPVLTELGSQANDINDGGTIVGSSRLPSGIAHAVVWEGGSILDIGTLGGAQSDASAINERGQVVGTSQTSAGDFHAFLWNGGVMTDLGTLGGASSFAYGINARGQVVGTSRTASGEDHAFVWYDGVMTDLGTLGGASSTAYAISASGSVVGVAQVVNDPDHPDHAAVWTLK